MGRRAFCALPQTLRRRMDSFPAFRLAQILLDPSPTAACDFAG
jgi:hypothetical protein